MTAVPDDGAAAAATDDSDIIVKLRASLAALPPRDDGTPVGVARAALCTALKIAAGDLTSPSMAAAATCAAVLFGASPTETLMETAARIEDADACRLSEAWDPDHPGDGPGGFFRLVWLHRLGRVVDWSYDHGLQTFELTPAPPLDTYVSSFKAPAPEDAYQFADRKGVKR